MKKLIQLFQKAGGTTILKQYWHGHVLFYALFQMLLNGFSKKSLEIVRLSVQNRLVCRLRKKYRKTIAAFQASYQAQPQQHNKTVWVCWLQGIENAPSLVQQCYRSLQENIPDRQIVVLTEENYHQYVSFPSYVLDKRQTGIISNAHFSDLLRLELLTRYGGTWIDATVFCSSSEIPSYMLDSDLFVFQTLKPGLDGHPTSISNWFISACSHEPILELTLALLYAYWKQHNALTDYYIFHDLFQIAAEAYPEDWKKVVPVSNSLPHILLLRLFDDYDSCVWQAVQAMTPFHKLTYKFKHEQTLLENTYYAQLFGK